MPLIQPVWDREDNEPGLVNAHKNSSIFSVSWLDPYTGTSPVSWRGDFTDPKGSGTYDSINENDYNMGITGYLDPLPFDHSDYNSPLNSMGKNNGLQNVAEATEEHINAAGWLNPNSCTSNADCSIGHCNSSNRCESNDLGPEENPGFNPVSGASPLGPMLHDMREFLDEGGSYGSSPIKDDPFQACRPKHMILLTDGVPAPEKDWASSFDANLNAAYSYPELSNPNYDPWNSANYPYRKAETTAGNLVNQSGFTTGSNNHKFKPALHVAGLNIDYSNNRYISEKLALAKMAKMAKQGETCAGYYLPELIPESSSPLCDSNDPTHCGCNPSTEICLDPQQGALFESGAEYNLSSFQYQPPHNKSDGSAKSTVTCKYPALVLDTELSPSATRDAANGLKPKLGRLMRHIMSSTNSHPYSESDYINQIDTWKTDGGTTFKQSGQMVAFPALGQKRDSPYLQGHLFRRITPCKSSGGVDSTTYMYDTSKWMQNLMCDTMDPSFTSGYAGCLSGSGAADGDRRRIFTAVPSPSSYNYASWQAKEQSGQGRFISDFELADASTYQEFGDTYIANSNNDGLLNGGRIRAMNKALFGDNTSGVYGSIYSSLSSDGQCALDYLENGKRKVFSGGCANAPAKKLDDETVFDRLRARSEERKFNPLGGIHQADVVTVGPPSADVPIDSYRNFKRRHKRRLGMMYVNTTDGLLHAIYTGGETPDQGDGSPTDNVIVSRSSKVTPGSPSSDPTSKAAIYEQREAWAYLPQFMHHELDEAYAGNVMSDPGLNQGTPVVQDVRLCHPDPAYNQNRQACDVVDDSGTLPGAQQWRTVLLSGVGRSNVGYFALDVTRPGGDLTNDWDTSPDPNKPDPIPLWELDESWEYGQVNASSLGEDLIGLQDGSESDLCDSGSCNAYDHTYLGPSPGQPDIGTTMVYDTFGGSGNALRRPVALIPGGTDHDELASRYKNSKWDESTSGNAVYVVDLQTGTILRRFLDFYDPGSDGILQTSSDSTELFNANITGSPIFPQDKPGKISTRAFVTDSQGRIFQLRMTSPNPKDWILSLYFDPSDVGLSGTSGIAGFEPEITKYRSTLRIIHAFRDSDNDLRVVSLKDIRDTDPDASPFPNPHTVVWQMDELAVKPNNSFPPKLTGNPVIFNNSVYFSTYIQGSGANACGGARPRVYGLKINDANEDGNPAGALECTESGDIACPNGSDGDTVKYYEIDGPGRDAPIVGLKIRTAPSCSVVDPTTGDVTGESEKAPKLVAVSAPSSDAMSGGSSTESAGSVDNKQVMSLSQSLQKPKQSVKPFSWTVIKN
jgi:hypothetical protein